MNKPIHCISKTCPGSDNACSVCVYRNIIARTQYSVILEIEKIPASIEQTDVVNAVEKIMQKAENDFLSATIPPESPAACGDSSPAQPANAEICPHYFKATDGVHAVVVGQCDCKGKLSAASKAE